MNDLRVYYGRCQSIYCTPEELRDIELIHGLWSTAYIIPFTKKMIDRAAKEKMTPFLEAVETADLFVFRALPNGDIPAGVGKELRHARENEIPILELPQLNPARFIDVKATRWYLHSVGQR